MIQNSEAERVYRIYIVEDHSAMRAALRQMIERTPNLTVCGSAASGTEALERVPELLPDLLLLDLFLPDLDGFALTELFRQDFPTIPIIIISGNPATQYQAVALLSGAAAYVDKMYAYQTLVETVFDVLGGAPVAEEPDRTAGPGGLQGS